MPTLHTTAQTLLTLLDNQIARTDAALEQLDDDMFIREPGGDCNTIRTIGRHLVLLRKFQLVLLNSPRADDMPDHEQINTVAQLTDALHQANDLLRQAITEHDPADWHEVPPPDQPREGKWGDEPTLSRFAKPFNDFTNHLGGIRALRRLFGCGVDRTQ